MSQVREWVMPMVTLSAAIVLLVGTAAALLPQCGARSHSAARALPGIGSVSLF